MCQYQGAAQPFAAHCTRIECQGLLHVPDAPGRHVHCRQQLDEAQAQLMVEVAAREQLEEDMRRAFMRGAQLTEGPPLSQLIERNRCAAGMAVAMAVSRHSDGCDNRWLPAVSVALC